MQKIMPFLWFNGQAEEAALFYTSLFKDSKMGSVARYGAGAPMPEGAVITATFELFGQAFIALNGGPQFSFNPSVSFVINCDTQEEIDDYWEQLSEGGRKDRCGWLQDKFGLSWQVVPRRLGALLTHPDAAGKARVMQAMLQMEKLDIQALEDAFSGAAAAVA